jgi:hypothetical protein
MAEKYWELSDEECPLCGSKLQKLITTEQLEGDSEPHEYELAERCASLSCKYRYDYED